MKKLVLIIVTLLSLNGYSQTTYTDLEKELFKIFNEYRISIGEDSGFVASARQEFKSTIIF